MYQVRTRGLQKQKDWERYIVLGKVLAIWGSHVHLHPLLILILYILCVRDRHHFARVRMCVCVCHCGERGWKSEKVRGWEEGVEKACESERVRCEP
jgi:hypothetical protein